MLKAAAEAIRTAREKGRLGWGPTVAESSNWGSVYSGLTGALLGPTLAKVTSLKDKGLG